MSSNHRFASYALLLACALATLLAVPAQAQTVAMLTAVRDLRIDGAAQEFSSINWILVSRDGSTDAARGRARSGLRSCWRIGSDLQQLRVPILSFQSSERWKQRLH